ncbi:unnamed protein product [Adineta steineri]|uniref:NHL repeat containing protein n=1 Tax=Adineta steineri TaxID=433720 RepID=A0A813P2H4_9BILA|nr:unnamed protein product [Adineta steineri]
MYSSALTTNNQMYSQPFCDASNCYYEAIQIDVAIDGLYAIASNSSIDTYASIYSNSFDPFNPSVNLISKNKGGCSFGGFRLAVNLLVNVKYILVVTRYDPGTTGLFSIIMSGPAKTNIKRITLSFNLPKFCPTADWNPSGTTFANQSTLGIYPTAFFIDMNNTVYAVNLEKQQILMWTNDSINANKIISANFSDSYSIFVTNNGDVYYDNGYLNGRVDKWISNTDTFVNVMNVNSSCFGLFVDINNTLYCSMSSKNKIVKRWLNDGEMNAKTVAGIGIYGFGSNQLANPKGIFVDVNFDLYVADFGNDRIQLFKSRESTGITIVGKGSSNNIISLDRPSAIVLDADKYLFIVDRDNHRIIRSGSNDIRCIIGCNGKGSQSHQISSPTSLSFDSYGNIFITDSGNDRIQKFDFLPNSCGKFKK